MNRCRNDPFGYCSGKPKVRAIDEKETYIDLGGKPCTHTIHVYRCRLDQLTCGFYLTQTKAYSNIVAPFSKPNSAGTIE